MEYCTEFDIPRNSHALQHGEVSTILLYKFLNVRYVSLFYPSAVYTSIADWYLLGVAQAERAR